MESLSLRASQALARATGTAWRSALPSEQRTSRSDVLGASLLGFDRAFLASHLGATASAAGLHTIELFEYSPCEGSAALREAIAANCGINPGRIQVTEGASEGLTLLLASTLDAGDRVLVPAPGLPAYAHLASLFGATPCGYSVGADPQETAGRIAQALRGGARAVLLNSVHNPSGYCLPEDTLEQIVRQCADAGATVLLDDAYGWMVGPSARLSAHLASLFQITDRIAVVSSIGKFLCLPGLRLGAVLTPARTLQEAVGELRRHLTHSSSPPLESLAASLINATAHHAAKLRLHKVMSDRRSILERRLSAEQGDPCLGGHGFYLYAEHGEVLDNAGILGLPGTVFGGAASARRYCLASSSQAWARVESH